MLVVAPYTAFAEGVADALDATGWTWHPVDVSGSPHAYWDLLDDLWREGHDFAVVEHDVLVQPGTLTELAACPEPWCGNPIHYFVGPYAGLACTKFTAGLIAGNPNALAVVGGMSDAAHEPRHYCRIDGWLQQVLNRNNAVMHVHQPTLPHVRDYPGPPQPSHGCTGGDR